MGVVMRRGSRRTGALAILSAAGGVSLAAMTATVSPGLIVQLGAFAGAGVAAETPVLAQPRQDQGKGKEPAYRSMSAANVSRLKLDDAEFWYYRKAPAGEGTWPGVLVLHDGWGLTVPLERAIDTARAAPVIEDATYGSRRHRILRSVGDLESTS